MRLLSSASGSINNAFARQHYANRRPPPLANVLARCPHVPAYPGVRG